MRPRRRLVARGVGNQIAATNILLSAALLTCTCCAAQAQAVAVERVDVLASGIYQLDIVRKERKDDAVATTNTIARARLVRRTSSVPLRRCLSFGFEYVVVGDPWGAQIPLRMITRFPSPGLRTPQTGMPVQATDTDCALDRPSPHAGLYPGKRLGAGARRVDAGDLERRSKARRVELRASAALSGVRRRWREQRGLRAGSSIWPDSRDVPARRRRIGGSLGIVPARHRAAQLDP